jgi:hypothetical protein
MSRALVADRADSPDQIAGRAGPLRCPDLSGRSCRALVLGSLLLALTFTWLLYRPTLDAYLLNDDFQWLVNARRFSAGQLFDISSREHFFRPAVEVYFFVVTSIFGQEPRTLRVLNLVLHSINLVLFTALMLRLSRSGLIVALTVVLFSTLPAYGEAVSWVSSVTVLLGTMFYLIAVIAHLRYLDTAQDRFRWLSLAAFVAAIGSHESAMTVPVALVMVDAFGVPLRATLRSRAWWAGAMRRYWPFFLVLAAYLSLELAINRSNYVVVEGRYRVGSHIFTNAFRYMTSLYVGRNTWPSYAMLIVVLGAIVTWGARLPRTLVLLLLLVLVPVLPFTWGNASRYTYLPSMLFAALAACLLAAGRDRLAKRSRATAWMLLICATGFLLIRFGRWSVEAARDHRQVTRASETCARALRTGAVPSGANVSACDGVPSAYRQALSEYEQGRIRLRR